MEGDANPFERLKRASSSSSLVPSTAHGSSQPRNGDPLTITAVIPAIRERLIITLPSAHATVLEAKYAVLALIKSEELKTSLSATRDVRMVSAGQFLSDDARFTDVFKDETGDEGAIRTVHLTFGKPLPTDCFTKSSVPTSSSSIGLDESDGIKSENRGAMPSVPSYPSDVPSTPPTMTTSLPHNGSLTAPFPFAAQGILVINGIPYIVTTPVLGLSSVYFPAVQQGVPVPLMQVPPAPGRFAAQGGMVGIPPAAAAAAAPAPIPPVPAARVPADDFRPAVANREPLVWFLIRLGLSVYLFSSNAGLQRKLIIYTVALISVLHYFGWLAWLWQRISTRQHLARFGAGGGQAPVLNAGQPAAAAPVPGNHPPQNVPIYRVIFYVLYNFCASLLPDGIIPLAIPPQ